jgi:hypothetical protein
MHVRLGCSPVRRGDALDLIAADNEDERAGCATRDPALVVPRADSRVSAKERERLRARRQGAVSRGTASSWT